MENFSQGFHRAIGMLSVHVEEVGHLRLPPRIHFLRCHSGERGFEIVGFKVPHQ
jgi:hypothetical protein